MVCKHTFAVIDPGSGTDGPGEQNFLVRLVMRYRLGDQAKDLVFPARKGDRVQGENVSMV